MTFIEEFYKNDIGELDESGAGISRVLQQLDSDVDFAMITAFRGDKSKKTNTSNNNALIQNIRKDLVKNVGAYKIVGHWKECTVPLKDGETIKDCKGSVENALESTWLIIKPDNISSDRFENAIKKQAKKYNQDAYVIRKNGKLTLNGKDGEVWDDLGKVNKKSLSTGFSRILDTQGYSELEKDRKHGKNRNIIFEDIYTIKPKNQNSSKSLFSHSNILY